MVWDVSIAISFSLQRLKGDLVVGRWWLVAGQSLGLQSRFDGKKQPLNLSANH
jgi:hypothetical protein